MSDREALLIIIGMALGGIAALAGMELGRIHQNRYISRDIVEKPPVAEK